MWQAREWTGLRKELGSQLAYCLTYLYSEGREDSDTTPVSKNYSQNYRAISLISQVGKLVETLVRNRITGWNDK